jgi:glycosyltransferase A (GT-A) superfamily protein (DUF2064 family)
MTTVAVLATPPVEGAVLSDLTPEPISPGDAVDLYRAMVADVCEAIQDGGADLLVNYRPAEEVSADVDPESALRDLLESELDSTEDVRYEPQVGESFSGRVGNTVTHLLESEEIGTVGVLEPTAAMLRREHVGAAMMKLRTNEVVLGPTTDGRVYFAGFTAPIDFADAYASPAVETLTDRGLDADLDVDFMPMLPVLEDADDLETVGSYLRSRLQAGRIVPPRTTARVEELELSGGETE